MIFSTQLAKQYGLDLDEIPLDELVQKIGSQLGEVERNWDEGAVYDGIVVVKIVECNPHPDADNLSLCLVDDGKVVKDVERNQDGLVQVVCGAPNAKAGMIAAWIPPGVVVPATKADKEPFKVGAKEIRGQVSQGMLASLRELGMGDDHTGILDIQEAEVGKANVKPGTPFKQLYGLNDRLIDIENKMFTHRPDLFGNLGIAREVAAIFGQTFKSPDWYLKPLEYKFPESSSPIELYNDVPDKAPRFTAAVIEDVKIGPSPIWLQMYLQRVGVKSINNIVDMTNLYTQLTAQPSHAFDYDKILKHSSGDTAVLGVRDAKKGEKIDLLNGKSYTLTEKDMVLATDQVAVDVAGIMGGANTEVDDNTTRILLSVGTYDMYASRRTSMRHGLFTDAGTRYTKGQSPRQNQPVIMQMLQDFQQLFGFKPVDYQETETQPEVNKSVKTNVDFINSRLGSDLKSKDIVKMLSDAEFAVKEASGELTVTPPFWRMDIAIAEDIVEEVGRLYGYDNLPLELPRRTSKPVPVDELSDTKTAIRMSLAAHGANETLNYSFVPARLVAGVGQDTQHSFEITNALSPDLEYYRQTLTASLLDRIYANIRAGYDQLAIFEIGRTHSKLHANDGEDSLPKELEMTSLVYADKNDKASPAFYNARSYLDRLASDLGTEFTYQPVGKDIDYPITKPYELERSALVMHGKEVVGIVGEYRQRVRQTFKLPRNSAGFEIDTAKLVELRADKTYAPLLPYPKTEQDVTLKVAFNLPYSDIEPVVNQALASTNLWYEFIPVSIFSKGEQSKNVSFRIKLSSRERTLEAGDISGAVESVVKAAAKEFKAEQV